MKMKWIQFDKSNLPKGEILAGNFEKGTFGYGEKLIGYIHTYSNIIHCVSESSSVKNVTHYIDIHQFEP